MGVGGPLIERLGAGASLTDLTATKAGASPPRIAPSASSATAEEEEEEEGAEEAHGASSAASSAAASSAPSSSRSSESVESVVSAYQASEASGGSYSSAEATGSSPRLEAAHSTLASHRRDGGAAVAHAGLHALDETGIGGGKAKLAALERGLGSALETHLFHKLNGPPPYAGSAPASGARPAPLVLVPELGLARGQPPSRASTSANSTERTGRSRAEGAGGLDFLERLAHIESQPATPTAQ